MLEIADQFAKDPGLMLNAIADMEVPHIRVLEIFAKDRSHSLAGKLFTITNDEELFRHLPDYFEACTVESLTERIPRYVVAMAAIWATLQRHGLIEGVLPDVAGIVGSVERRRNHMRDAGGVYIPRGPSRQGQAPVFGSPRSGC